MIGYIGHISDIYRIEIFVIEGRMPTHKNIVEPKKSRFIFIDRKISVIPASR